MIDVFKNFIFEKILFDIDKFCCKGFWSFISWFFDDLFFEFFDFFELFNLVDDFEV